ncbi:MAG: NarK/NasA family nitrate transporter [Bacteroidetes bacterium]|nr:NarK/NasA family nitrate transporter [Bacteroidota bacterium]
MMMTTETRQSYIVLAMNTLAFTVCFAVWTMNGVLITFLVDQGVFSWDKAQIGWLIGIPVLTGSIVRLPLGVLTDKYGGRIVYGLLMLVAAVPTYMMSMASSYEQFIWGSLGFGLSGGSFAVGIAYSSIWFSKERQGTALGIFGAGNAGSALTSLAAPSMLKYFTNNGENIEGWRTLPKVYALALVAMAVIFFLFTKTRKIEHSQSLTLKERLAPLRYTRVWRFGLYYFVVFGGFVSLAQWLIPYYVNAYGMSVALAGLMASIFSFPSGVIRALGGWLSDKHGARAVMYWVFGTCLVCFVLLCVPRMDIESPGQGVMADKAGVVSEVTDKKIVAAGREYSLLARPHVDRAAWEEGTLVMPTFTFWQEPVVAAGDTIAKKQLLAKGITHIFFQANVWIFTFLVFSVGIMMGIGKAAVYKYIPEYFPNEVGVVGGIVGVIGGLGGFFCPIIFGYLLKATGIWTTAWMFFFVITLGCHLWLHATVRRILREQAPKLARQIEDKRPSEEMAEEVPLQRYK